MLVRVSSKLQTIPFGEIRKKIVKSQNLFKEFFWVYTEFFLWHNKEVKINLLISSSGWLNCCSPQTSRNSSSCCSPAAGSATGEFFPFVRVVMYIYWFSLHKFYRGNYILILRSKMRENSHQIILSREKNFRFAWSLFENVV